VADGAGGSDASVAEQRDRLRDWLRGREPEASISFRETHVSILAFTRDRVWKCKKAVRFPFIDLSTAERRRANCEREVMLNRRVAPDVYLGVVLLEADDGTMVDALVEMLRLPADRRLSAIVESDDDAGAGCVDRVAEMLSRFHSRAARGRPIDAAATPGAVAALWTRNFLELQPFSGLQLDRALLGRVNADAHEFLAGRAALLEERISSGRICDGHGDLLADDVFCLPDAPRVLDCLEFDDALRYGDGLADAAFLAMDLERLGRDDLARRFLDHYRRAAEDRWPDSLAHFYVAYRAMVRSKVACLRAGEDETAAEGARSLLGLAARHLAEGRVRLVLVGGPPATGKSTLARALARETGWPVFHSDELRKELAGFAPGESGAARLHEGIYSAEWNDRTYGAMLDRARELLMRGSSVILDASWRTAARRLDASRLAADTSSSVVSFRCDVSADLAGARASARAREGTDASDASAVLAVELRNSFEPWPAAAVLDASLPPDALAAAAVARLHATASS
jgi:aminoglycoside phosphotransferase family enzyme/predicted kinase